MPPDAESADGADGSGARTNGWPGVAPPAGWFLHSRANGPADSVPEPDLTAASAEAGDPQEDDTGEWFASPAPDPGESPISWYEGMDDPEPDAEPPAPDREEHREPVGAATTDPAPQMPEVPGGPAGNGTSRRSILAAEPVVNPTRALRGRPGGPGLPPRRPGPGARRVTADRSPWQTSQRLWTEAEIPWDQHPADGLHQPVPADSRAAPDHPGPAPDRPGPAPAPPGPAPVRPEPRTWARIPRRNPPQPPPQQAWPPRRLGRLSKLARRSFRRRGHRSGRRSGSPRVATSGRDPPRPSR